MTASLSLVDSPDPELKSYARISQVLDIPNLIPYAGVGVGRDRQITSFESVQVRLFQASLIHKRRNVETPSSHGPSSAIRPGQGDTAQVNEVPKFNQFSHGLFEPRTSLA